jgi:hypothetical protein
MRQTTSERADFLIVQPIYGIMFQLLVCCCLLVSILYPTTETYCSIRCLGVLRLVS